MNAQNASTEGQGPPQPSPDPNPVDKTLELGSENSDIPTAPVAHGPVEIPQRIGRYRIEQLLGSGGFGSVYLAHDEWLDRQVAIKLPKRDSSAPSWAPDAYVAEGRIVASLEHSGIVPVYDVGCADNGQWYIVSKFVHGQSLAERVRAGGLSHTQAALIVATVAEAAHFAHKKGIVHRDIKPANILLDESGKVYLCDFGIALPETDFGRGSPLAGTAQYMSPEQASGTSQLVDGRSDVFSLGAVFYELLTGKPPFTGKDVREVLEFITNTNARPPRQRVDSIPAQLERICLKALSREQADRYTTAKDLADDLHSYLRGSSSPATLQDCSTVPHDWLKRGLEKFGLIEQVKVALLILLYPFLGWLNYMNIARWREPDADVYVQQLQSPDPAVRIRAVEAIRRLGPTDESLTGLLKLLRDDPEVNVRMASANTLVSIPGLAQEVMVELEALAAHEQNADVKFVLEWIVEKSKQSMYLDRH